MKAFVFFLLTVNLSAQADNGAISQSVPMNTPIKAWTAVNPQGKCKFVLNEPEQRCPAPRGNLFYSYGDRVEQQILHYVDSELGKNKDCRIAANSTLTVTGYEKNSDGKVVNISYRNSKQLADKASRFFNLNQEPIKRDLHNGELPLCKNGDDYFMDSYEIKYFWELTLNQDFGALSNYQLGENANPYDKPLPNHQVDGLMENDRFLGVVVHGWAALQDATKIIEKFDAEKAKEILRTGSSAHPEQAVFTNEAYRWDIDHRIGDRYFELNGACVDYSQMQYQFVDASFCKK